MTTAARIDELRKKFEENPRRYFAPLANELRKAGELSQAIALCREHLPRQPGHMSGFIVFGQALFESGELGEARAIFEQALALDPENLIALRHLGDIARRQGDPVVARRWYERVLDADPRNDDIAAQLATLTTPAMPMPAVVAPAADAPSSFVPTPAYAVPPIMLGTLPTPDAAMRAVDIGAIPVRAPEPPPLLDLDAIEAVGEATEVPLVALPLAALPEEALPEEALPEEALPEEALPEIPSGMGVEASVDASIEAPFAEPVDAPVWESVDVPTEAPAEPLVDTVVEAALEESDALDSESARDAVSDSVLASEDDPFAFAALTAVGEPEVDVDVEAAFEEGLAAPEWPDTTALVARLGTPRTVTPVAVEIPADAVDAFGREPQDAVAAPATELEPAPVSVETTNARIAEDIVIESVHVDAELEPFAAADVEPVVAADMEPVAEVEAEPAADQADESTANGLDVEPLTAETDLPEVQVFDTEVLSAADELEEVVSTAMDDDALPWLAASSDPSTAIDEVTAMVEAMEEDARSSGEADDVAVVDRSEPVDTPIEASFAGVMPSSAEDETDAFDAIGTEPDASPAFVTETMGELLVAQGLTAQAVAVYEELVRRRPYDPVLSSRLAELHESLAPAPAVSSEPVLPEYTARERFARLAARRAPRRTPALAPRAVDAAGDESLSALFGTEPMPHEDAAARTLAAAFAPLPDDPSTTTGSSLFSATPAAGTVRQRTPLRPMTPLRSATPIASPAVPTGGDYSFDRFFPDPAAAGRQAAAAGADVGGEETPSAGAASAGDDLAQFSAWLKGLGNT